METNKKEQSSNTNNQNNLPFPAAKRKSRIVLDEKKEYKNYAMEFESLYDNYERDVDFVDNIDSINSQNSGSFKENKDFSGSFRKRSSIIPYGKKPSNVSNVSNNFSSAKKEENENDKSDKNFNIEVDEFFKQHSNSLKLNRKSSILGILESNINKKNNNNEEEKPEQIEY